MEKIELLSPVGDFECLKAAVQNGADAVYLGASTFSARARATNFDNNQLYEAICYAKLRNVKVHLALNTLLKNDEFNQAVNLAINAYNFGVDAIIVQDLGLASYLHKNHPEIPLHASTQMTVHNLDGVNQLEKAGFSRVVLSRELSLEEIQYIRQNTKLELEVFIHGALCISYSGQCLLSSMIGGRSGNRGLCAQPCRLQYELIEESNKKISVLNKGYLLSPKDNFGVTFLPELIKSGISSLKIEGRMKTPTYVAVVTKFYRKYIDLIFNNINLDNQTLKQLINKNLEIINNETGLSDKEEITQVFNRGGFSTGHFSSLPNKELIFKEKPNNMGIYVGTISNINENKGHITLTLENSLSIGDKISINDEIYTISELMINNQNFESLEAGHTVKIGRMKGKLSNGSKIYKLEDSKLNKYIFSSFKEDKNFKKVKINGEITVKSKMPISLKVWSYDGFYKDLEVNLTTSTIPQKALRQPLTKDKLIEQISRTGNTEFEFENLFVNLDKNLFVQTGALNELRRKVLNALEELVLNKYKHNLENVELQYISPTLLDNSKTKKISLLLNILKLDNNYLKLSHIDKLYIPLNYFLDRKYETLIKELANKFNIYIYLPNVIKDNKLKYINFKEISQTFSVKGFVISHLSQLEKVSDLKLENIGNFTLNIYNNYSINKLKELGFSTYTISPELSKFEINDVLDKSCIPSEVTVYGKTPVMTNNYCYLGESNKCYKDCKQLCKTNNIFYLKDRLGFKFRILPDTTSTITTIFNSKTLSIKYDDILSTSIRIDILDENINEIQKIIDIISKGNCFEGQEYTNGNF